MKLSHLSLKLSKMEMIDERQTLSLLNKNETDFDKICDAVTTDIIMRLLSVADRRIEKNWIIRRKEDKVCFKGNFAQAILSYYKRQNNFNPVEDIRLFVLSIDELKNSNDPVKIVMTRFLNCMVGTDGELQEVELENSKKTIAKIGNITREIETVY